MRLRSPTFLPSTVVIELTYQCNHNCIFCSCPWYAPEGSFSLLPELSTAQCKKVINELCSLGIASFAFTGGEALMREDCIELLEYTSSLSVQKTETVDCELITHTVHPEVYLLSNGVLVDHKVMDVLERLNISLSMSLPGLSTFEEHTGYDNASMILDKFKEAHKRGIPTTVNSTVTALNLHELRSTLSAALLAGAGQLLMNRFLPGGRGLSHADSLTLTASQVRKMLLVADDVLTRANRLGNLGTEIPLCLVDDLSLETLHVGTRCSAAKGFFVIGPSGFVRVCNHSEVRLNHINDWKNLKHNEYWNTFTMRKYLPAECGGCRHILNCDGGCREAARITGGSVSSVDPVLTGKFPDTP
ncbi:MAG: radical SAM protein [Candidatus Sabulitectum sp.]|nr:radical SAM protein [Candidatus Sabulitectum sp.]